MSHEHLVLDGDTRSDEAVALGLHALANHNSSLDLDERTDLRIIADFAAIEIDEVVNGDVLPQFHVRGYPLESALRAHWCLTGAKPRVACHVPPSAADR